MTLQEMVTEILAGEYAQDFLGYGKDSSGNYHPIEVDVDGKQYVIDEQLATKLDTLIAKDFATETTLDTRLSNLETKMDTILSSQDIDGNFNVSQNGSNELIENTSVTFADGATVNTEKNVDIALPANLDSDNLYQLLIHNPSTITNLENRVKVKWTDSGGNVRYSQLTYIKVGTAEGKAVLVQGSMLGEGFRVTISNDTALGTGEGFTAYLQVREV